MPSPSVPVFCREEIDTALAHHLPSDQVEPKVLHAAMRYSCLAPGKRLRPALVLASTVAVGGQTETVMPAACALEMVHVFSLIHDDLPSIDNDDLRRGIPTCHKVYGEAVAILAGDALFSLAFRLLAELEVSAEQRIACTQELAKQTGSMGVVGGEVMDILLEGVSPTVELLNDIHGKKTGALIAGSCAIGGLIGGAREEEVGLLRTYGFALGLAFQIVDDILNETATVEVLGKAVGSDQARGKMTYPSLMGIDAARSEAKRQADIALASLAGLPGDTGWLRQLAQFTIERDR